MKINLTLSMKNALAQGTYDTEDRNIKVQKGAIFEKTISKSFKNHHYNKLRERMLNSGIVDNTFVLKEDYLFNSLSSAAAVIGGRPAAGTYEWKLEDGRAIGDYESSLEIDVTSEDITKKYNYVTEFLENISDLDQLQDITKFNLFETLSIVRNEIRHSNVLSWLLNPNESHELGDMFIQLFIRDVYLRNKKLYLEQGIHTEDIFLWDYDQTEVYRERDNIDILLIDRENQLVIVIENKVDTTEHHNQLNKYKEIVREKYSNFKQLFVYLTKDGDESSDPDTWGTYSYDGIIEQVDRVIQKSSDSVSSFLKDYRDILRRHIMTDEDLMKLCRRIYYKHKKALDLIYEYKPDMIYEISEYLKEKLSDFNDIELNHCVKRIVRFTDDTLRSINRMYPNVSHGWVKDGSILLHELQIREKDVKLSTVIGPSDGYERDELIEYYNQKEKQKTKSSKKWTTIKITNIITYKEDESLEEVKSKIDKVIIDRIDNHLKSISTTFESFQRPQLSAGDNEA